MALLNATNKRTIRRTAWLLAPVLIASAGTGPTTAYDLAGLGDPFTVNTRTKGSQAFPAIDSNEAGMTVVAFTCEDPDLSNGICIRRYTSTGLALGDELRVNAFTNGNQSSPDVAIDEAGRTVVVWESNNQDGDLQGIYGRRVDAKGHLAGVEFRVNTTTAKQQRFPRVASQADGRFWVVWTDSNEVSSIGLGDIIGRRYAANGNPLTPEVLMNMETLSTQQEVAIAMAPNGVFVLTWATLAYPGGGGTDIAAQRFAANGARQGNEIHVNDVTNQTQSSPAVDILPDGRFVVAWESFAAPQGIYFRRFNATGVKQGVETQASPNRPGLQIRPDVGLMPNGDIVVAWRDSSEASLWIRCFQPDGTTQEAEEADDQASGNLVFAIDANGDLFGAWQNTGPDITGQLARELNHCTPAASALCVNGSRFQIEAQWVTDDGNTGPATPVKLTGDTGYFWFFNPTNVEVVIKVLNPCGPFDSFWVFAAGLTNVEVDIRVTDTETGKSNVYHNAQGKNFVSKQDTSAFECDALGFARHQDSEHQLTDFSGFRADAWEIAERIAARAEVVQDEAAQTDPVRVANAAGSCNTNSTTLCLTGNRFAVRASYETSQATSGQGTAVPITADTGYFWFFNDPANVEVVVKALNACSFNPNYWVFSTGLTNVKVILEVTDTMTGAKKTYINPLNQAYELNADTAAFACP